MFFVVVIIVNILSKVTCHKTKSVVVRGRRVYSCLDECNFFAEEVAA